MTKKSIRRLGVISVCILFLTINWFQSDYQFFRRIIHENNLKSPDEVYTFVLKSTPSTLEKKTAPCLYCSPEFLWKEKLALSCDEGAIIIAHLSFLLGYESRLVDLIGNDGIAHHTMVEVKVNNEWQRYDYLFERKNGSYTEDINFDFSHAKYRPFPRWYNTIIYNFAGLKYVITALRGARG